MRDHWKRFSRRYAQLLAAVLYNCNFKGFADGRIYQGNVKGLCVPGLNCYSCPGAVGSCPLGSLQTALLSSKYKFPYYVLGTFLLLGLFLGRLVCGFLCPFGLLQELLYKLPTPKLPKGGWSRSLSRLKYAILAIFVIGIPLFGLAPGFCKYVCPAGTLEAGIPLAILQKPLRKLLGALFTWKVALLLLLLFFCVFAYRGFCRFLCPLGAIYSFFNPCALLGIRVDQEKCIHCDACVRHCKMDVKKVCDRECIQCGECMGKCPTQAIRYGVAKDGKRGNAIRACILLLAVVLLVLGLQNGGFADLRNKAIRICYECMGIG